jgi:hypothetical protein
MAATTEERVRKAVARVGEELAEKAWTVGRDAREEARKRRRWGILQGLLGAVFALLARKAAVRTWGVLTGEPPPNQRTQAKPKRA